MPERNFMAMLRARQTKVNSLLCVGLDSGFENIPSSAYILGDGYEVDVSDTVVAFNKKIVEATHELVCVYKLNPAFYLSLGLHCPGAIIGTIQWINQICPDVPIIFDAKWADKGNTSAEYARAGFGVYGADAVTVNPYMGQNALQPFLDWPDKGVFVVCRTSNPGAREFQVPNIVIGSEEGKSLESEAFMFGYSAPLYQHLAYQVAHSWNSNGNCGLVMGATYPNDLGEVRKIIGDMPILVPGIGAQGGDIKATMKAGLDSHKQGLIISASRSVIFASSGPDFAERAGEGAKKLRDEINECR